MNIGNLQAWIFLVWALMSGFLFRLENKRLVKVNIVLKAMIGSAFFIGAFSEFFQFNTQYRVPITYLCSGLSYLMAIYMTWLSWKIRRYGQQSRDDEAFAEWQRESKKFKTDSAGFREPGALKRFKSIRLKLESGNDDISPLLSHAGLKSLILWGEGFSDEQLGVVGKLRSLRMLQLGSFSGRKDVGPIGNLTKLQCLKIEGCDSLLDASGLADIRALRFLTLTGEMCVNKAVSIDGVTPNHLKNLDFLPSLPALESLIIKNSLVIQDAQSLANLPCLKELRITCAWPGSLKVFQHLPSLKTLELVHVMSLDGISAAPNLCDLKVSGKGLDLGPLRDVSNTLEVLTLHTMKNPKPLSTLGSMPKLRYLSLHLLDSTRIVLEGIEAASELNRLSVQYYDNEESIDLRHLQSLKNLQHFDGWGIRLDSLEEIRDLPLLQDMSLKMGNLTSLSGFQNLPKLEEVELYWTGDSPGSLDGLEAIPSLKRLKLRDCPVSLDVEALKHLPSLQRVTCNVARGESTSEGPAVRIRRLCPNLSVD